MTDSRTVMAGKISDITRAEMAAEALRTGRVPDGAPEEVAYVLAGTDDALACAVDIAYAASCAAHQAQRDGGLLGAEEAERGWEAARALNKLVEELAGKQGEQR